MPSKISDELMLTALNALGDSVAIGNRDMEIVACNDIFAAAYKRSKEDIIGRTIFEIYPEFKNSVFYESLAHTLETGLPTTRLGYSNSYGRTLCVRATMFGDLFVFSCSQLSNVLDKSMVQVDSDSLTSLKNRICFDLDLETAVKNPVGLIILDINKFKELNEDLGYFMGDIVLMEVAARIKYTQGHNKVYRLGGDRFAAIFEGSKPEFIESVKQLLAVFAKPFRLDGEDYPLRITLGVHFSDEVNEGAASVLQKSEAALSSAKIQQSSIGTFKPTKDRAVKSTPMVRDLLNALRNKDELSIAYQPQIDLITGKVCGAEALIRWQHPTLGNVSPAQFLTVAESHGIIRHVDKYVIEKTTSEIRRMFHDKPIPIAINLSAQALSDKATLSWIQQALENNHLDANSLSVEITESTFLSSKEKTQEILERLKALGIKASLDDFGTGYSSLGYINSYPIDFIKIDREFIMDIHKKAKSQNIVKSIVNLSHSVGAFVVAEGVETKEELDFLNANNCDIIQGYYFSKPLPLTEFQAFIQKTGVSNLKSGIM